jgi:hypothetical protein
LKPRIAVALFTGLLLTATVSGATSALTAMPLWAVAASGMLLVVGVRKQTVAATCAGALAGLSLPHALPPASAIVLTHGAGSRSSGDLFALLDRLDENPNGVLGRRVTVSGEWAAAAAGRPATVSRRVMTCCAADAISVGFDVLSADARVRTGDWVRAAGLLSAAMAFGETRYRIVDAQVTPIAAPSER